MPKFLEGSGRTTPQTDQLHSDTEEDLDDGTGSEDEVYSENDTDSDDGIKGEP